MYDYLMYGVVLRYEIPPPPPAPLPLLFPIVRNVNDTLVACFQIAVSRKRATMCVTDFWFGMLVSNDP